MAFMTSSGALILHELLNKTVFVLVTVIVLSFVTILIVTRIMDVKNKNKPIQGMRAKVLEKRGEQSMIVRILFQTEDGDRVELACSAKNKYVVGDEGFLKWQGTRLISFERDR